MLLGVFDSKFVQIAKDNPTDPASKLEEALPNVLRAMEHFRTGAP
jgi:hypothetical protein